MSAVRGARLQGGVDGRTCQGYAWEYLFESRVLSMIALPHLSSVGCRQHFSVTSDHGTDLRWWCRTSFLWYTLASFVNGDLHEEAIQTPHDLLPGLQLVCAAGLPHSHLCYSALSQGILVQFTFVVLDTVTQDDVLHQLCPYTVAQFEIDGSEEHLDLHLVRLELVPFPEVGNQPPDRQPLI